MGKRAKPARMQRTRRRIPRLALLLTAVVLVAVAGMVWLRAGPDDTGTGTPRLAVDRTVTDLGYLRFDSPARVVFALRNAGDGPLRLREVPRVTAAAGC